MYDSSSCVCKLIWTCDKARTIQTMYHVHCSAVQCTVYNFRAMFFFLLPNCIQSEESTIVDTTVWVYTPVAQAYRLMLIDLNGEKKFSKY